MSDDDEVERWVEEQAAAGELEPTSSNKCRVCRDAAVLALVNKLLAVGFTVPDVMRALADHNAKLRADGLPEITRDSLYNHRSEHFDVQSPAAAIYRRIQEEAALKYGADWREGVGTVLNAVSYHQTLMIKGYETLMNPAYVVDPIDGAKSAQVLHNLQRQDEDAYDRAQMLAKMNRIVEVVRHFVPKEQWPHVQDVLLGRADLAEELETDDGTVVVNIVDDDDSEE